MLRWRLDLHGGDCRVLYKVKTRSYGGVMNIERPLLVNAVFSLATGAVLTVSPTAVGSWLGVTIDGWLRVLGLGLIAHGFLLVWVTRHHSTAMWAKLNIAAIAAYPAIMVALVVTDVVSRPLGQVILLVDGVIVGLLAVAQWWGLRDNASTAHPVAA